MRRFKLQTAQDLMIYHGRMFAVRKPQGLADRIHSMSRGYSNWNRCAGQSVGNNSVIRNQH